MKADGAVSAGQIVSANNGVSAVAVEAMADSSGTAVEFTAAIARHIGRAITTAGSAEYVLVNVTL